MKVKGCEVQVLSGRKSESAQCGDTGKQDLPSKARHQQPKGVE